jgi:predicted hotdog family 3-hydroxylacyl-ACP dehydratase
MMAQPDIRDIVPHSGSMVLLDRVLDTGAETLRAEVAIHGDSQFCEDGAVGAWVGIEYMAQAIAAFAGHEAVQRGQPVQVGFLLGSRRYECATAAFAVGQVLHVLVQRTLQGENGLGSFDCRIEDAATGAQLASGAITVFQPPNLDDYL